MDDQRSGKRSREEKDDEQANSDRNKRQKTGSEGSPQLTDDEVIQTLQLLQEQGDFPPDAIDNNDNGNGGNDDGDNNTNRSSANNNHNNNNGQKDVHSSTDERTVGVSSGGGNNPELQIFHVQASMVQGSAKPEQKTSLILAKAQLIQDEIRAVRDGRHYFYAHSPTVTAKIGDKIGHLHRWVTETHTFFYLTLNTRVRFEMIFKDDSRTSIVHFCGTGASPSTIAARNKARTLQNTSLSLGAPQAAPQATIQNTVAAPAINLGEPQITRPSVSILVIAPKQVLDVVDPLLLGEFKHKKPSPEATLYWESRVERHWCVAVASDTAPLSTIYDLCSSAGEIVMFVERQQDVPITYVQKLNHRGSTTEFEDKSYMFPLQNEIHFDQLPNDARHLMMTMVDRKKKYGANVLLGLYLIAQNCEEKAIVDAAYEWILAPRVNVKYALCFCARFNSLDVDPSEAAQIFQNQGAEDGLGVQSVVPGRGSTIVFFTAPPSLLWLIRLASFEYFVEKFRKHGLILTSLAPATKHHLAQVIVKNRDEPFRDRLFDLYCQLELEEKIIANTVTEDRQAALKRQNAAARVRRILGSRLEFYPREECNKWIPE